MAETTPVEPVQEPVRGSEEWIARTLKAKGLDQGDEPEVQERPVATEAPSQGEEPEAEAPPAEQLQPAETTTSADWREVVIPPDEEAVPKEFRGITAQKLYDDYQKLLAAGTTQQQRLRELEAKVAAKETIEEFLREAKSQQQQQEAPTPPRDPYREAGLDPEVDSVLNPTRFHQVQEQVFLDKAKNLVGEELNKLKQESAAEAQKKAQYDAAANAIAQASHARGFDKLDQQTREERVGYMLFKTSMKYQGDPSAIFDPNKLLEAHDAVWGNQQAPAEAATQPTPPDPPGVKKPAAIDSSKPTGPQLKSYQREAMNKAADDLRRAGFKDVDTERFAARYAANLKRAKE
jgi:hypothetical protein